MPDSKSSAQPPSGATEPGQLRAEVSRAIVRLYAECYGKGPTRCRTFVMGDLIVSVLEDIFTTAEKTLVSKGEKDTVHNMRLTFQGATEDAFRGAIEELVTRPVRSFCSAVDVENSVAYEMFLLEADGELTESAQADA